MKSLNLKLLSVALATGIVIGVVTGAGIALGFDHGGEVRTVEGVVNAVNSSGDAIGFDADGGPAGEGYVIAGAMWKDRSGSWHDGANRGVGWPTCLEPLSSGQKVRLGIVDVPPGNGPGRPTVVWLECLTGPTDRWAALQ